MLRRRIPHLDWIIIGGLLVLVVLAAIIAQALPQHRYAASARQAVDALKDVQGLVHAGITYGEYTRRIGDTRIAVNRFLRSQPTDEVFPSRSEIALAMNAFERAAEHWQDEESRQQAWKLAEGHIALADQALSPPPQTGPRHPASHEGR